jgi:riboflavin kinase/FMN adenylyltransferase
MKIIHTFEELAAIQRPVSLAIGVFDGVHLGHQRVIGQARDDARQHNAASVVLTFDPHPARILRPEQAPPLLTSTGHKLRIIETLGVDACLVLPFDKQFASITATAFLELLVANTHRLREICVGTRFRFGHDRTGDIRLIEQFAAVHGFNPREIKSVKAGDDSISSTAIRDHIRHGNLDRAAAMLGRPYSILGTVEKGDGIGHQLGYPTANLNPHSEAFPPDGVYAAHIRIVERASRPLIPTANGRDARSTTQTYAGVLNLGRRPTFEGRSHNRVLEVHIFDFDQQIYGEEIEVIFHTKLRGEQKFSSVDELKKQIVADIAAARRLPINQS